LCMTTTSRKAVALPSAPPGRTGDPSLAGDASRFRAVLSELIRVVQFRDRDRACCYDVSVSQCYALKSVVDAGGLSVNDLAAHLYLDKSTASRIANSLVDKGYLIRERHPEDARVVTLVPTSDGAILCAAIEAGEDREYAGLLADFEPGVRAEMSRLLAKLGGCFRSNVEASGGSCCVVK
jgi:MarR family transcriptional regulator, 2-MHQ and catechol-resistance regulon repressor